MVIKKLFKSFFIFLDINQANCLFPLMTLFKLDWAFPSQESSFAGGEKFLEYLEAGGPADEIEGFKILWRVTNPLNGTGTFVAEATDISKMWEHAAPWIKGFGCMCEVEAVFSDEQFVATAKKIYTS